MIPFPRELTTPPVTKMYFVAMITSSREFYSTDFCENAKVNYTI
jgi:hypothetical protein